VRVFQNNGLSRGFRSHRSGKPCQSFTAERARFLDTRFAASHILFPVFSDSPDAFYTNGDDENLQRLWAREHGLKGDSLEKILLAQIEQHRTDVFYNLDPVRYGSAFIGKLPGCVKKSICWRAAPSGNADLTKYDLVVSNFPSILDDWRRKGCRVGYFFPAHDPAMDAYAASRQQDLDLIFIGGFSRHHVKRSAALSAAASVSGIKARFYLEDSRLTRLANFLPFVPGLGAYRHPEEVRTIRAGPIYGRDAYAALSRSLIAFNGAVDMAGGDRGNMRCYASTGQIPELIQRLTTDACWANSVGQAGRAMVRDRYSKQRQWAKFQELV
jgi:hypothetical protein